MRIETVSLSTDELRDAVASYVKQRTGAEPEVVQVHNRYGKICITIPLTPGWVVRGEQFQEETKPT